MLINLARNVNSGSFFLLKENYIYIVYQINENIFAISRIGEYNYINRKSRLSICKL